MKLVSAVSGKPLLVQPRPAARYFPKTSAGFVVFPVAFGKFV